jgi:hypothetical protein
MFVDVVVVVVSLEVDSICGKKINTAQLRS